MDETERLRWQETVDSAVDILEMRIGLRLVGLAPPEISYLVREWIIAKADSIELAEHNHPDRH
jgi:hypothetical protein